MVEYTCLDSNVVIELLKNNPSVTKILSELHSFAITTTTLFELWAGRKEKESDGIKELLSEFIILSFNETAALIAADMQRKLKEQGESIEFRDIFIAAACIEHSCSLFTLNKKHFARMEQFGLKLIQT